MLVDKPAGMTSHDAVAIVRRRLGIRSIGHTGTLDPFATGLLVLVVGSATRLARFVGGTDKEYRAEAVLGVATTTDDLTGEPRGDRWTGPWPSADAVRVALGTLVGAQAQVPPAFSAKSVDGVRSYRRARAGVAEPLEPVPVVVHELALEEYAPPMVRFRTRVGTGTYVRALARDLGERLGTGAHLSALRRTSVGAFRVEDAIPPAEVTAASLIEPLRLLGGMTSVELSPEQAVLVRQGRQVGETTSHVGPSALVAGGELIAIAEPRAGRWQPVVVLSGAP